MFESPLHLLIHYSSKSEHILQTSSSSYIYDVSHLLSLMASYSNAPSFFAKLSSSRLVQPIWGIPIPHYLYYLQLFKSPITSQHLSLDSNNHQSIKQDF